MSSEVTINQFLDEVQTPIKKLSLTQLRKREEMWRALWSWLDDEVKLWLIHAGSTVRVVRRDYKGTTGELGSVKFDLKRVDLYTYEKQYNYNDGKYYFERKTVELDGSYIAWWEFISEATEVSEVDTYEVESIPEEAEVST